VQIVRPCIAGAASKDQNIFHAREAEDDTRTYKMAGRKCDGDLALPQESTLQPSLRTGYLHVQSHSCVLGHKVGKTAEKDD
jgi:hypothetical protein